MGLVDCGTDCKDTADEIAPLEDCLKDTAARIQIVLYLLGKNLREEALMILEDATVSFQWMVDKYLVRD